MVLLKGHFYSHQIIVFKLRQTSLEAVRKVDIHPKLILNYQQSVKIFATIEWVPAKNKEAETTLK